MSFPYLDEIKELDETTRREADGSFIALADGTTHFELSGDVNGAVVVLVHGFSVPYFIYDNTFAFLVNEGFRVLRYDLFGRGYSDRPRLDYNIDIFVKQLKNLLDGLNIKQVSLLGLSMGGPITTAFTSKYPEYVTKQILIDPAGARPIKLSSILFLAKIPILSELFLGLLGSANMVKNIAADIFDSKLVRHFQERYKVQMQYKGFKRAILSTIRSNMLESFEKFYLSVGKLKIPTLLFWGKNDATVPFEHSKIILAAIPHAQFHAIENCGHIPHYEKPEIVNPILLEFLSK
ncbi:MAG TPA: alpha/beta hydrolase [Anaerolineales bacterium]|nr:alpha/beta hydrolase [Anaerolineales bacterium]